MHQNTKDNSLYVETSDSDREVWNKSSLSLEVIYKHSTMQTVKRPNPKTFTRLDNVDAYQ